MNVVQPHRQDIDDSLILFPKPDDRPNGLTRHLPLYCLAQPLSFASGHSLLLLITVLELGFRALST